MKRVFVVSVLAFTLQACSDVAAPDIPLSDLPVMPLANVAAFTGPSVWTVDAGSNFSCGVATDGTAYCWGYNGSGRNGIGMISGNSLSPVAVNGNLHFLSVSVGTDHACGVATDNRAYCWGTNGNGRTGTGVSTGVSWSPVAVAGDHLFTSISAGNLHTCAVAVDGTGYCWGDNASGQLGDDGTTMSASPVVVVGNHTFTSISAGGTHSCGVTTDAGALCWGSGLFGQLGGGVANDTKLTPTALQGAAPGMVLASTGTQHTCASTETAAYCWGLNSSGQLGTGTYLNSPQPVAVQLGSPIALVNGGASHTCGVVLAEGAVYCWGSNSAGQLGNGTTLTSPVPVRVALQTSTIAVSIVISPSDASNAVSLNAPDPLEVALLGADDFDASTVDPSTLQFAGATAKGTTVRDVNGDGLSDLVAQFAVADLTLPDGTSQACASGRTLGGVPFHGCADITVMSNQAPTAAAGGPYEIILGEAAQLDASASSDPDGDALTFDWDFGDGSLAANAGPQVSHVYAAAGSFSATVTVSDGKGGSDVASATVTVLSALDAAKTLEGMLDEWLGTVGKEHRRWARPLAVSVRAAIASLKKGHTHAARGQLRAFINKVKSDLRSRRTTPDGGEALIGYARRVLRALGD